LYFCWCHAAYKCSLGIPLNCCHEVLNTRPRLSFFGSFFDRARLQQYCVLDSTRWEATGRRKWLIAWGRTACRVSRSCSFLSHHQSPPHIAEISSRYSQETISDIS
jgi:hypothetical protein